MIETGGSNILVFKSELLRMLFVQLCPSDDSHKPLFTLLPLFCSETAQYFFVVGLYVIGFLIWEFVSPAMTVLVQVTPSLLLTYNPLAVLKYQTLLITCGTPKTSEFAGKLLFWVQVCPLSVELHSPILLVGKYKVPLISIGVLLGSKPVARPFFTIFQLTPSVEVYNPELAEIEALLTGILVT